MRDNSREYELTTPDGTLLFTRVNGAITRLKDIAFGAAITRRSSVRSQHHGVRRQRGFKAGGLLDVTLQMRPENGSEAEVEANRSNLVACLNSLLDGEGVLEWTNRGAADPIQLTELVLSSDYGFKTENGGALISVQLESAKPFAEDADATVVDSDPLTTGGSGWSIPLTIPVTFTASSGGDLQVDHVGDFSEAFPVLRAYGPITNPNVINQTTGERLVFVGSIASGDYWEIDLWEQTVTLNGSTPIRALNVRQSVWWSVGRGVSDLQLAGSGYTAQTKLRALMRSSWG